MGACPTVCVCVGFVGVGVPVMKHFLKLLASQGGTGMLPASLR